MKVWQIFTRIGAFLSACPINWFQKMVSYIVDALSSFSLWKNDFLFLQVIERCFKLNQNFSYKMFVLNKIGKNCAKCLRVPDTNKFTPPRSTSEWALRSIEDAYFHENCSNRGSFQIWVLLRPIRGGTSALEKWGILWKLFKKSAFFTSRGFVLPNKRGSFSAP